MAQGFNQGGPSSESGGIPGFSTSTGEGTTRALQIQAESIKESNNAFLKAMDQTIKFTDEQFRKGAEEEAKASVDSVQEDVRKAFFERELQTTAVQAMPESTPKEIQDKEREMARIKAAYDNGSLTSTHYWSRLDATARSLRARYPGYKDEIDATVAKYSGGKPANQIVSDILGSIEAENKKQDKDYYHELWKDTRHLPAVAAADAKGIRLSIQELRRLSSEDAVRQHKIKMASADLDRANSEMTLKGKVDEAKKREVIASATEIVNLETSRLLDNVLAPMALDLDAVVKAQIEGRTPDAAVLNKLGAMMQKNEEQFRNGLEGIFNKKRDNGKTLFESLPDQAELDRLRKASRDRFNEVKEAIIRGDGAVLNTLKRSNDLLAQGGENAVRANRLSNIISGMKAAGIPEPDISLALGSKKALRTQYDDMLKELTLNVVAGNAAERSTRSIGTAIDSFSSPDVPVEARMKLLDESLGLFQDPKVSLGTKNRFYNFLFGDNTPGSDLMSKVRPGTQREEVFAKMLSPKGLDVIKSLEQDKPGTIDKFRKWVEHNGVVHAQDLMNAINTINEKKGSVLVIYSKEEQRFKAVPNPSFKFADNPTVPRDGGNASNLVNSANKAVAALTPAFQTIYPKRDVTQQLFNFLTKANLTTIDTPKE